MLVFVLLRVKLIWITKKTAVAQCYERMTKIHERVLFTVNKIAFKKIARKKISIQFYETFSRM